MTKFAFLRWCCEKTPPARCLVVRQWITAGLIFVGCSGPDYPQVVYPPDSPRFTNPDLRISVPGVSLTGETVVSLEPITISRPSAEIVVSGTIAHGILPDEVSKKTIGVMFLNGSGEPMCVALCFPTLHQDGSPTFEVHLLGPARPGTCRMVVRTLTSEPNRNIDVAKAEVSVRRGDKH